jgi:hypothetical protein
LAAPRALEALSLLAFAGLADGPESEIKPIDPEALVLAPWWVVHSLEVAFSRYRFEGETLEQAFGLPRLGKMNPKKRGPKNPFAQQDKILHQRGLALEVANRLGTGGKVEAAVDDVAKRWKDASRTVWTAWKKYGHEAQQRLKEIPAKTE